MLGDPHFRIALAALSLGLVVATLAYWWTRARGPRLNVLCGALLVSLVAVSIATAAIYGSGLESGSKRGVLLSLLLGR